MWSSIIRNLHWSINRIRYRKYSVIYIPANIVYYRGICVFFGGIVITQIFNLIHNFKFIIHANIVYDIEMSHIGECMWICMCQCTPTAKVNFLYHFSTNIVNMRYDIQNGFLFKCRNKEKSVHWLQLNIYLQQVLKSPLIVNNTILLAIFVYF